MIFPVRYSSRRYRSVFSALSSAPVVVHLSRTNQLFLINKSANMCSCGENAPKRSIPAFTGQSSLVASQRSTSAVSQRFISSSLPPQNSKMPGETAVLRFVKLSDNAHAPTKGSALAAGYDLKSAYNYIIPGHGKELVKTDLQIQLPEGCYGRVAPRSGLSWKNHIDVGAGVIDADYTGNLGIVLFNHAAEDFEIKAGDRVAQLICERILYPDLQEVAAVSETARGAGGFGSTGKS